MVTAAVPSQDHKRLMHSTSIKVRLDKAESRIGIPNELVCGRLTLLSIQSDGVFMLTASTRDGDDYRVKYLSKTTLKGRRFLRGDNRLTAAVITGFLQYSDELAD